MHLLLLLVAELHDPLAVRVHREQVLEGGVGRRSIDVRSDPWLRVLEEVRVELPLHLVDLFLRRCHG